MPLSATLQRTPFLAPRTWQSSFAGPWRLSIPLGVSLSTTLAITLGASLMPRPVLAQLTIPTPTSPFVLDFEGLDDLEAIADFYNGGSGGNGLNIGYEFGVTFSDNALALRDADDGGVSGNFGGEPTSPNVLFFRSGPAAVMNVESGFTTGFSLFYSAVSQPGKVNIYEDLEGQGSLLASFDLPLTPLSGAPDPTGQFSPFLPMGSSFEGVARSVVFEGAARRIGFDNMTLGAEQPLTGRSMDYAFLRPDPPPTTSVPESDWMWAIAGFAGWLGWRRRKPSH